MKRISLLVLICVSLLQATAQSDAFRAQGHYYSAKSSYKAGSSESALSYVYKCKEILKGTNRELQYIHIMAAYNAGKYEEAQKEMKVFFDLQENNLKPVYFSNSVEKITDNEVLDITKLINELDDRASEQKKARIKAEQEKVNKRKVYDLIQALEVVLMAFKDDYKAYSADKQSGLQYKTHYQTVRFSDNSIRITSIVDGCHFLVVNGSIEMQLDSRAEFRRQYSIEPNNIKRVTIKANPSELTFNDQTFTGPSRTYISIEFHEKVSLAKTKNKFKKEEDEEEGDSKSEIKVSSLSLSVHEKDAEKIKNILQDIINTQAKIGK